MNIKLRFFSSVVAFLLPAMFCVAQVVPVTRAQALDKSVVTFPRNEGGKTLILVISFSRKGQKECDSWNHRLKPSYMQDSNVEYYEMADFEGVPPFVMRFILHGMRREVPKDEHSHFVPFLSSESDWKKLVNYSQPKDAYVVVADASGRVLWQAHGAPNDEEYSELQTVVAKQILKP